MITVSMHVRVGLGWVGESSSSIDLRYEKHCGVLCALQYEGFNDSKQNWPAGVVRKSHYICTTSLHNPPSNTQLLCTLPCTSSSPGRLSVSNVSYIHVLYIYTRHVKAEVGCDTLYYSYSSTRRYVLCPRGSKQPSMFAAHTGPRNKSESRWWSLKSKFKPAVR